MVEVTDVQAKPGYVLELRFSDGTTGNATISDLMERPLFAPLADEALFKQAYVEHGVVCWPGDIDIAPEFLYARAHGLPRPETFEQAQHNELEMSLRELRKLVGMTQADLSGYMGMAQSELSRFERREDFLLSTLRQYVQALGGKLEIAAVIGDKRIVALREI